MKTLFTTALVVVTSHAAFAEETRQMDAHEHGVGQLDVAIDGNQIAMELQAPGADIVGFEYVAESAEDRAKVDAAMVTLAAPLDLFEVPAGAACSVVQARASLESFEEEDGHAEDDHDSHDHEKHDEHADDDHGEEDHAEHDHGDEDHAEHADDDHGDEDHAEHAEEARHTEFHAKYLLDCADTTQASLITFGYFDAFPNALELEVQVISDKGATAFEVERDAPTLDLRGMF